MSRVVITGMGVISPLGNTIDTFWQGLVSGRSGIKALEHLSHHHLFERLGADFHSKVVAEVEHVDVLQQLPTHVALRDRYVQFAVAAALQAVRNAQMEQAPPAERERWGIVLTTAVGPAETTEEVFCQATHDGQAAFDPTQIPPTFYLDWMCNTPTALLAQLLQIYGPCDTISSACASGIDIIGYAYELIRDGEASIMLAVASEAPLAPTRFGACDIIHCLATNFNEEPQRASRPFDSLRNGFVLGEGAAAFLLEEREHALSRGAHIYGEITGFGLTSNATHMISLKPTTSTHLGRALSQAMHEAHLQPEDIHYINPHASSTNQNDQTETKAIKETFGQHAYQIPLSATKSELGHALGTSGFFGAIAATLSLEHGIIHPTINYEHPDPLCDLDYVPNQARLFTGSNALIIASGFSGIHTTLVIQKAER